ncbi:hypothetical protein B0O99DRAFT_595017 [Bisporella sp. PMI_857]|nr:hypothetical protein B0O99DRAFT_595017 [Bisporella sp. PMI_857]
MSYTDSDLLLTAFDGAIKVFKVDEPGRSFYYDVTFFLDHPHLIKLASAEKPPMHFHPYQEEYIKVIEGTLGVEVEKSEYKLTPQDGEFLIKPWVNHRLYPILAGSAAGSPSPSAAVRTIRFLLSAEKSPEVFQLDDTFFQNWYGYQDEVVMGGGKFDLIQVMNMFDAGGSYLTLPTWVPFSRRLAQVTGIVIGRWLGGLLGYQPFHRKWTTDWQLASKKMATSTFLRHFANRAKNF